MNFQNALRSSCMLCTLALSPLAGSAATRPPDGPAQLQFDSCAKPVYPPLSLRAEAEGKVTLEFRIAADGTVKQGNVVVTSMHPALDKAALDALSRCRFTPTVVAGLAVEAPVRVQYVWTLEGGTARPDPRAALPAPIRAFLVKARAADAIIDPLQRCLAFPDLPGNQWPAGLAAAACELVAGPRIGASVVAEHLGRGALAELDALYRHDLERHLGPGPISEAIHRDFADFDDAGAASERLSRQWLEKAPDSAFANAARAHYLAAAARQARGTGLANDTAPDAVARMSDYAGRAIVLHQKALRIEPRLLPSHVGLIEMGRLDSRFEVLEDGFKRGAAIDPACHHLSARYMKSLQPRWGATHESMRAYAGSLKPLVAGRPLLALNLGLPELDMAELAAGENEHAAAAALLAPQAMLAPQPAVFGVLGAAIFMQENSNIDALARLMVAYRFDDSDEQAAHIRGEMLVRRLKDYAWALPSLKRAVQLVPTNSVARVELGFTHFMLHQYDEADAAYAGLSEDAEVKDQVLGGLFDLAMARNQLDRARGLARRMTTEFPTSHASWYFQSVFDVRTGDRRAAVASMRKFVELAGTSMPQQVAEAQEYIALSALPAPPRAARSKKK